MFRSVSKTRIVFGAVLGAIYGIVAAVVPLTFVFRIVTTLILYAVIPIAVFGKMKVKSYIKSLAVFLVLSVLLGGFISLLTMNIKEGRISSVGLIISALLFVIILPYIIGIFRTNLVSVMIRTKIVIRNKSADFLLLCDSGNVLTDPYNGHPVILLGKKCRQYFDYDICKDKDRETKFMFIKTVNSLDVAEVIIPDEVVVETKRKIASVCFLDDSCFDNDDFDGIIPSVLVEDV